MQFPIKKRGGKKLLEERKKRVLQAIVEEYIKTAEPVSSGAIMNLEGLEYSSATIRNEMAELEKMGYIEKTHTSSGRVPSAKGYRYYVDELLEDNKITVDEIDYISKKLETKVNELEEITQIASSTISEITHYTTVTIGPNTDEQKIENINSLDYYILVKLDNVDMTYSIQELDEAEFNEIFNSPENVEKNAINKNSNNELVYSTVNDETICTNLLSDYKLRTEANIENAFSKVDEEYKNKKYTSINEYEEYINKNENVYGFMKLSKYQKEVMDDYTQYICLDRAGHYYIFRETSPMQYTVILDTYTIDLPEFVEQYNSSSEDKKVQFNIQKFFDAINDGDYSYAYSKLDQTYKNNNFPTQTDFENYMKTNFYAQNKLGYTSYEKNGDLYIYKMVITNGENSSQTIEKQFVVKLLDGTNFVMSFEK